MKFEFVKLYKHCKFKWYLKYGMEIESEDEYSPTNVDNLKNLIMDTLEFDIDYASKKYYDKYPIISNLHVEEVIKINALENKLNYPRGILKFNYKNVDIITDNKDGSYDLYEVVHSEEYKETNKLSILKYQLKNEMNIRNLKVLYIPDVILKQLPLENTLEFRNRLLFQLDLFRPKIYDVFYNQASVDKYLEVFEEIKNNPGDDIDKNIGFHCYSCEYENICRRNR